MHLYLHVPYCAAKCPYCDFNSIAGRDAEHAAYVDALLSEVRTLPRGPYATVFVGGGTPTMLGARDLARLMGGVRDRIALDDRYEWTCEANPGSVDAEKFRLLAEHGVNRLSLGIQSTDDRWLKFLGRVHDSRQAERALALARAAVPRVSADIIIGLPGQGDEDIAADLALYRRHDLAHASVYHLTFEPGTEFHALRARGAMTETDPVTSRRQLALVTERLAAFGLDAYETSNFARGGEASRHNLAYWHQRDYHAAGAGAVSTVDRRRVTRHKHPAAYIDGAARGDTAWKVEALDDRAILTEAWMLGLRLASGVARARLRELGDDEGRWLDRARVLAGEGLVAIDDEAVRLTPAGRPVQDDVTVYLMPS
ncbi:MAG TPA: radical SAM family heme chaperone HemW [Planctomycetota bacterium]|nr:radical SAM family heme chaperone HemW [Planctomycetota bacterium]